MNRNGILISVIVVIIGAALLAYAFVQHRYALSSPRTFNLAEYGIALTIPGTLNDLSYTKTEDTQGPGTVLHMHIKETCEIGMFYEIKKTAIAKSGTPWTAETLEKFENPIGNNPARVKEFTDFYLVFEPSQEPCASDEKTAQTETDRRMDLWNALVSARYMSY